MTTTHDTTTQSKKQAFEVKNYRQIKVGFIGPSNTRGARIKIFEPARYNGDTTQRKHFSYDYSVGDIMEQAYEILTRNGFNVVARASEFEHYIFLCDNWSDEFFEIKDLK